MMSLHTLSGAIVLLLLAPAAGAQAAISGTAHDFSGRGWTADNQICVVCHVPHNPVTNLNPLVLLWNHDATTATFQPYQSNWMSQTPGQPGPASIRCLSCHDGTVATDSFSGRIGTSFLTFGNPGFIDTDLRDDHPVGMEWTHRDFTRLACSNCHNMHSNPSFVSPLVFYDKFIECGTCHEPHGVTPANPGGSNFLRISTQNSAICQHCHNK